MSATSLADLPLTDDVTTVLAHCPASVAGLPISVLPIPAQGELLDDFHATPRIYVAQRGRGTRWYRQGSRTMRMHTAPRMVEIYERGLRFDHCRWDGDPGRCVLVEFDDADVQALTHGEMQSLTLRTEHEIFDERVSRLTLELAEEALKGLPNGRLFAQGLSLSLLGLLSNRYIDRDKACTSAARRLSSEQRRRLTDLIEQEFGSQLSMARMSNELGLSPYHFARLFKASFGTTPHHYVQERRLEIAAAELQKGDRRSVAEIAVACGFASQSHMTAMMRARRGFTPGMLRRGDGA